MRDARCEMRPALNVPNIILTVKTSFKNDGQTWLTGSKEGHMAKERDVAPKGRKGGAERKRSQDR